MVNTESATAPLMHLAEIAYRNVVRMVNTESATAPLMHLAEIAYRNVVRMVNTESAAAPLMGVRKLRNHPNTVERPPFLTQNVERIDLFTPTSRGAAEKVAPINVWGLEGRPIYYIL